MDLVTTTEVAERFGVDVSTVTRWVHAGRLSAFQIGGGTTSPYVFRREDVDAFKRLEDERILAHHPDDEPPT